jgi:CubicO group peptidase (beta-lactamase class C family)
LKVLLFALSLSICVAGCESVAKKKNEPLVKDTARALAPNFPKLSDAEINKYHNELEYFFNKYLSPGRFNGGILVAKNGQVLYERYSGFVDLRAKKDSMNAETSLQIASTSKTFTAAAVLKLMQEGKIKLDQLISDFFPGFPYQGVTVKTLLNHRSGLPNYLNYIEALGWNKNKAITNEDVINTLINQKPTQAYRPDAHFNYCNTNYVLLASIVEKVSGTPFPQYMKQNFFDPLGMKNTFVKTQADSANVNYSYQWNGALWRPDFSDGPYGDKNVYSTPRDLLKWDQSLYANTILTKETMDLAFTPYSNEKPGQHNYGLGWRMLLLPTGKKVIYHNGRWHGFNSCFDRLVDDNVTVIILNNRFNIGVYNIARKSYDIFGNYGGKSAAEDDNKE